MSHQRFLRTVMILMVLMLPLFTSNALSLTLLKASTEELTTESTLIVVGKIAAVEYVWEDETHRSINTLLTVEVDQYVKGAEGSPIVVKQLGGQMGELSMAIPGTPVFDIDDEMLLFLVEHNGDYWIHSIALGVFKVITENDGRKYLLNDLRDINLIDPLTNKNDTPHAAYTLMPMYQFIREIESYLNQN